MKIAICDDERLWSEQLAHRLEHYYQSLDVLIHCFDSGTQLLDRFGKGNYDLVFLDIEMPETDGISVARRLRQEYPKCMIIFLTSHTDLAMRGYEVEAFRFLAKPIEDAKLEEALEAAEKRLLDEIRIEVTESGTQRYLDCSDIQYIKSENVYLQIVTGDKTYLVRKKLQDMLTLLPAQWFVQVHRSYAVNLKHVASFDGKEVCLREGSKIQVSRSRKALFQQKMMGYMKEKF